MFDFEQTPGDPVALATLWGSDHLELVFVRHGQPLPPAERGPAEAHDPPLTRTGIRQSRAAAELLAAEPVDAVYSSRMARARMTAELLAEPHRLAVRQLADLREVEVPDTSVRPATIGPEAWQRAGREFIATGRWESFPSAEPSEAFRGRLCRAIDGIILRHRNDRRVVVACHNGVLNAYVAGILEVGRDYFFRPAHGSVTRIWSTAGTRTIWSLNETAHLGDAPLTG